MKTLFSRDICSLMFIATLFTVARAWKQLKDPSVDEWMKKMCYIMEYYSALKEILMKLQNIMLSERSQTEKNKNTYFMVSLVSGILKKKNKKS